jgi:hypothetical protein
MADIDENDPLFSRANMRDIKVAVLLTPDEYVWSKEEAEKRDLSHSAYIRGLIIRDRREVEMRKLSSNGEAVDIPSPAQLVHRLLVLLEEGKVR